MKDYKWFVRDMSDIRNKRCSGYYKEKYNCRGDKTVVSDRCKAERMHKTHRKLVKVT